jgi:hypothetical protein
MEHDYLWAVGNTPFGYFSHSASLSAAQRDVAARNIILSEATRLSQDIIAVLQRLSLFEGKLDAVMLPDDLQLLGRRCKLVTRKLEKAEHFLALHNHNRALEYLRSAERDLEVLCARQVVFNVTTFPVCFLYP